VRISTVIITRNEEKRIADCIRSVLSCSDEILVLDSFSEDDTVKIAEGLGANVIQRAFEGYGASKNYVNSMAKGDYILSMDADERLDEELLNAVLKIRSLENPAPAYRMQRLNNYCGQWIRFGAWNPDRKVRLWKKGMAEWNLSEVHEQLVLSDGVVLEDLPGKLLHYSYATRSEHLAKIRKYAQRGAREMRKSGMRPFYLQRFLSPVVRWLRDYFGKLGFLDGFAGLQIASLTAYEVWLKYSFFFNSKSVRPSAP
jgi:glycosyltransferase involved in cell wall biosynthesis